MIQMVKSVFYHRKPPFFVTLIVRISSALCNLLYYETFYFYRQSDPVPWFWQAGPCLFNCTHCTTNALEGPLKFSKILFCALARKNILWQVQEALQRKQMQPAYLSIEGIWCILFWMLICAKLAHPYLCNEINRVVAVVLNAKIKWMLIHIEARRSTNSLRSEISYIPCLISISALLMLMSRFKLKFIFPQRTYNNKW